jgi:hypothetical protein
MDAHVGPHAGHHLMGRVITAAIAAAVLSRAGGAQTVRLGVVMDEPREQLEREWTEQPRQVERAYCVIGWWAVVHRAASAATPQDDSIFRVARIEPANVVSATTISAEFECAAGVPELHVHPPTTCAGDDPASCINGGLNAYSCQPSREDLVKVVRRGDPFGVVQCDRRAFRFYYPSEYGPPATAVLAVTPRPAPRRASANAVPAMAVASPDARGATPAVVGQGGSAP